MSGPAEMLAVFPESPPPDLVRTLDLGGYRWKAVSGADDVARNEPAAGWAGAVVCCDIDPEARAILDSQASWLQRFPQVRATIEGHADERGTREYNLALGDRRANAAKNYLVARGIDPSRLTTISYGKERPLALGSDDESSAQNRRAVTIVVS